MKEPEIREKEEFIEIVYTISKKAAITYKKVRDCIESNKGIIEIADKKIYEEINNLLIDEQSVVCRTFGTELDKLEKRLPYLLANGILKKEISRNDLESIAFEIMEIVCPPVLICENEPTIFHYVDKELDYIVNSLSEYLSDDYIRYFKAFCKVEKCICGNYYNGWVIIESFIALETKEMRETDRNKPIRTYLMKDSSGLYKIGCSAEPHGRLESMRTGNATIELVCVIKENIEKELHIKYANKRVKGEWFKLSEKDVRDIKRLAK